MRVNAAEGRLLRLVNVARRQAGVRPLRLAPGFTDVARRWSKGMAVRRTLTHNPHLAASVQVAGGASWRVIGENVAFGGDADSVFRMYMASAPHRANILSPSYQFLGIGWVERDKGRGYTTLVFSSAYSHAYGPTRVEPGAISEP